MAQRRRIFISVAEDSADVHAAALVREARGRLPECEFYGLTGPRLRELGVETVYDFTSHAAMLGGVVGVIGRAWHAVKAVEQSWRERRPDVVVLLDSPELHLRLARKAKTLGLPVLYYIAPQTWAAREYRNRRIARDVDRLACILPFEQAYFRQAGVRADFVGHPLFETLDGAQPVEPTMAFLKQQAAGRPIVALLPGSRRHVIDAMLPRQLDVMHQLRTAGQPVYAAISCVADDRRPQIRQILMSSALSRQSLEGARRTTPTTEASSSPGAAPADLGIDVVVADNASLLTAADVVLVASGTAALEVAYYRKPMIVVYDAGRLLRWPHRIAGRFVLKTPHLSLVNILADARVVPEFMPFIPDTRPVAQVLEQLLNDASWRELMTRQIEEVVAPLRGSRASERVCGLIDELIRGR